MLKVERLSLKRQKITKSPIRVKVDKSGSSLNLYIE
jgi:hypothetical protein